MAEPQRASLENLPDPGPAATKTSSPIRSFSFKYYLHDRVDSLRLQLIGELNESEVTELSRCWQTAKSTLGIRKLILDVRALKSTDDAGKRWLDAMQLDGAVYSPESFSSQAMNELGRHSQADAVKLSLVGRVLGLLRGSAFCGNNSA